MKKSLIFQWIQIGLFIIIFLELLLGISRIYIILTFIISLGLSIYGLVINRERELIIDFVKKSINENKNKQSSEASLQLLQNRIEIVTLQNQINPHFLYNTLDSMRSQALFEGQKNLADMTERLARFFRYCINSRDVIVKIQEEMNHIQDYYFIQKYRFEDKFDMVIIAEEEGLYDLYMPKQTLQPLIENAIAHGLEKVKRNGKVTIRLCATQKKVLIVVEDNGIGMSQNDLNRLNLRLKNAQVEISTKMDKHNGIALMNLNQRIKLFFGQEYGILFRSIENIGTSVEICIPKIDEFERAKYEKMFNKRMEYDV